MNYFHCDICNKQTMINPPFEQEFEDVEVSSVVPETVEENGVKKLINKEVKQLVRKPIVRKMRRQNISTGDIEEIEVAQQKDLYPRAYLVRLSVGPESIQKDFCKECLEKILPDCNKLWDALAAIKSQ